MGYPKKEKGNPMKTKTKKAEDGKEIVMPSAEEVARELGKAKSIDDFYGKEGIFSRLFSKTIEQGCMPCCFWMRSMSS